MAEGNHAVRIAGSGRSRLTQQVAVCPSSNYRASVLVSARAGKGSDRNQSQSPLHSANVLLEELDAKQQVIAEHRQAGDLEEGVYRYLSCEFTTSPQTASVRFVLETRVDDPSITGPVRYDHCVLDGPPAPCKWWEWCGIRQEIRCQTR